MANALCDNSRMTRDDWTPDDEAERLYGRYKRALETERELKDPVREQATRDLKAGASVTQLAKLTGMTPEVFRRIARAEGVERKREPTVGREAEAKKAQTGDAS